MCAVVPSNQQMFCVPRALNHPWKKVWQLSFQFVSQMKEKMVGKKKDYSGKIFFFCHKHRGEKLFQSHFNIFFFFLTHLPLRASVLYFKNIQEFFLFVLWKIFFSLCLLFSIARVNNWGFIKFLRLFFFSFWNTVSWIVSGSDTKKHRQTSIMASSALRNSLSCYIIGF